MWFVLIADNFRHQIAIPRMIDQAPKFARFCRCINAVDEKKSIYFSRNFRLELSEFYLPPLLLFMLEIVHVATELGFL